MHFTHMTMRLKPSAKRKGAADVVQYIRARFGRPHIGQLTHETIGNGVHLCCKVVVSTIVFADDAFQHLSGQRRWSLMQNAVTVICSPALEILAKEGCYFVVKEAWYEVSRVWDDGTG
jgi:hypothetical protein